VKLLLIAALVLASCTSRTDDEVCYGKVPGVPCQKDKRPVKVELPNSMRLTKGNKSGYPIYRYYDKQYNTVCYVVTRGISCIKGIR